MLNRSFDAFIGCDHEYADADVALFGAPFDSTTSFRPGARFAPRAIRGDSQGLETYSPYQDADLLDVRACDLGDVELPFGSPERALSLLERRAERIIRDGKRPFMIGGEHLATLGPLRAAARAYPDLHVLHFDAHTDLREDYLGERLSHATVMRRVWELVGNGRIFQFGIRSGEKAEFEFARQHATLNPFALTGLPDALDHLKGIPVYLTIDLDVLDPSVFPGTGTPEPGGVSFQALHQAVLSLKELNIVALDVVELSPPYDPSGISTAAACKLIRELLLVIGGK